MQRTLALSDAPSADSAAKLALVEGASALSAVTMAFFALAGQRPGVLFAPLTVLVGGVGQGSRVFDGRPRQPGVGEKRPRGFLPTDSIPGAARLAVPMSVAALAVASAYQGGISLAAPARAGAAIAKKAGAPRRAALLAFVAEAGGNVLGHPGVSRTLLANFGPAEGGNLGPRDLEASAELDGEPTLEGGVLRPSWHDAPVASLANSTRGAVEGNRGIVAVDASGAFAVLHFAELGDVLCVEEFDVAVPALGAPVMRGEERRAVGSVVALAAPAALERDQAGRIAVGRVTTDLGVLEVSRDAETKLVRSRIER